MKTIPFVFLIALSFGIIQSTFNANAQLYTNPTVIDFGATLSGQQNTGANRNTVYGCAGGNYNAGEKVYTFDMAAAGTVSISLSNIVGSDVDLFLLGSCSPITCLAFGGTSINNQAIGPGTYFIVVDGLSSGQVSTFGISFSGKSTSGHCIPDFEGAGCSKFIDSVVISATGAVSTQKINSNCTNNSARFSATVAPTTSIFREGDLVTIDFKTKGSNVGDQVGIWMDFNNNGSFDDAGDFLGLDPVAGNLGKVSFTIPAMASFGPRRLRLRSVRVELEGSNFPLSSSNACTLIPALSSAFPVTGETEDYILNLEPRCTPKYTLGCTGNAITSFTLKGISNQNSSCNGNTFNYINYPESQFTTTLSRGVSYTATLGLGTNFQSAGIWIDYNGDGDFLDANEFIGTSNGIVNVYNQTFTVPTNVTFGKKKLRIRSINSVLKFTSSLACGQLTGAGETEDYVVNIIDQTIISTTPVIAKCRGESISVSFTTTGDFLPGNRFFAQFSNAAGSFATASQITEIELVGNSPFTIQIPANLVTTGNYLFRIASTSPVRTSATSTVSGLNGNCTAQGLTTLRIGSTNDFSLCKGTSVLIPFASVNFSAGTVFKAQISGPGGALPFVDIPGATATISQINALIPFSTPQGSGYKIRVVSAAGFVGSNSSTNINLTTCLTVTPAPTSICIGLPTTLPIVASGVPAGTTISAELSSNDGNFSNTSPVIIGRTNTSLTSIQVIVPCGTIIGTFYKIRLIPNNPATPSEAGAATAGFTLLDDCCPILSPPFVSFGNNDGFCLNRAYTLPEVFAQGCFFPENTFFFDFLNGSENGTLVASIPVSASGQFTIPTNFPVGSNLFYRIRSTSPVVKGPALGPVSVSNCPTLTLTGVCRVGGEVSVSFTTTGNFGTGNQFIVKADPNPGTVIQLGNPSLGSPMLVPSPPFEFNGDGRIFVSSTNPVINSSSVNIFDLPACPLPTITLQALSNDPKIQGTISSSPSATVCPGGKLRIDFTTSGIIGSNNVFKAKILGPSNFSLQLPESSNKSPLVVEVPANLSTSGGPYQVQIASTVPVKNADNLGSLNFGSCPAMGTGNITANLCASATISVPFIKTGTFNAGNVFSAELSDANGSFLNPTLLIGSGTASPLSVTLPNIEFPAGTNYRIRVKSSNPELVRIANASNLSLIPPVLNTAVVAKDNPFIGDIVTLTGTNLTGINRGFFGTIQVTLSNITNTSATFPIPTGFLNNDAQVKRNGCLSNKVTLPDQIQAATNFNLFDASTDQNLGVLKGGSSIDLTDLTSFNIRGNLNSAGFDAPGAVSPGSVKIELVGPVTQTVVDNNSPFTFFGETVRPDGTIDYLGSILPVGNYTIKATPYEFDNAVGKSGVSWTTAFSVAPARVITTGAVASLCQGQTGEVSFSTIGLFKPETQFAAELSDATGSFSNPTVIGTGSSSPITVSVPVNQAIGAAYRIRVTSSNPLTPTLNPNSNGAIAIKQAPILTSISESVIWTNDQVTLNGSGFNGLSGVFFNGLASGNYLLQGNGNNQLKARVPTGATSGLVTIMANGGCKSLNGISYTIPKISEISVIHPGNQQLTNLNEGMMIALNENPIPSFLASVEPPIAGSVRFELSGPTNKTVKDLTSPFSLCGDSWDGFQTIYQACNKAFLPGNYTLTITPYQNSGISKPGESKTMSFSMTNMAGRMALENEIEKSDAKSIDFQVFPNPTSGKITIRNKSQAGATVHVLNILGQTVLNFGLERENFETELDLEALPSGIYHLHFDSGLGSRKIRLIRK